MACSSDSDDESGAPKLTATTDGLTGTWSAKVEGTDAFLAVVANGDEVVPLRPLPCRGRSRRSGWVGPASWGAARSPRSRSGFRCSTRQLVHVQTAKAAWKYRVRACNATKCSAYSAPIIGSNFVPRAPTGLSSSLHSPPVTELGQLRTLGLNWTDPDLGVIEHVVRMSQTNPAGPQTDVRRPGQGTSATIVLSATTPTSTVTTFPKAVYDVSVASCSRIGCSNFGPKVAVDSR
jgi:hypothetical protein